MRSFMITVASILLLAAGCGHSPADGESIDEVCVKENHNKVKSVSGYLKMFSGMKFCERSGCPFLLTPGEGKTSKGDMRVKLYVRSGVGPRRVEIKKENNPSKDDIVFRDDKEQTFHTGAVARMTGRLKLLNLKGGGYACHMDRIKGIQKLDE